MYPVSGSSFSCLCCELGLFSCALNSTAGIPTLWQPSVTHCTGACLGRRRGREGKVHRDFKKLLSLPLNTLFDTPQHLPSKGVLCKPHRPLLQSPALAWLSPGIQGTTEDAFRYCITVWNQGSAFEWKTQVSLKELGIWLVANSAVQLWFSHHSALAFLLGLVPRRVRFLLSPRVLLFWTVQHFTVRCILPLRLSLRGEAAHAGEKRVLWRTVYKWLQWGRVMCHSGREPIKEEALLLNVFSWDFWELLYTQSLSISHSGSGWLCLPMWRRS